MISIRPEALLATFFAGMTVPSAVLAYVGPGAGLGALGIVLAVVAAILMSIVGLLLWPIRLLSHRRKLRDRARHEQDQKHDGNSQGESQPDGGNGALREPTAGTD